MDVFGVLASFGLSLRFARGQAFVFRQNPCRARPSIGQLNLVVRLLKTETRRCDDDN